MRIPELVTQMMTRVQRLNLTDAATGKHDPEEISEYILVALRYLATRYNLLHLFKTNREFLRCSAGIESYAMPTSLGFIVPEEPHKSGLAVSEADGSNPRDLRWYPPQQYELLRSTSTGKPIRFTLANNKIHFQPTPDSQYLIQAIQKPWIDETMDIPEEYIDIVTAETLYRLSADKGSVTPLLLEERMQCTKAVVNHEARLKTRFQNSSYNRMASHRGRHWGR